jgi:hypothetical protein
MATARKQAGSNGHGRVRRAETAGPNGHKAETGRFKWPRDAIGVVQMATGGSGGQKPLVQMATRAS